MSDLTTIAIIAALALVAYVGWNAVVKAAPQALNNLADCGTKNCPACNRKGGLQTTACGQCLDAKCRS